MDGYVIAYDFGTTGVKTCVFAIKDSIEPVASALEGYDLYILDHGGGGAGPEQWWKACALVPKKSAGRKRYQPGRNQRDFLLCPDAGPCFS